MRLAFVLLAAVAAFASGFTLFRGSKPAPTGGKALPTASTAEAPVSLTTGQASPEARKERLEAALRADSKRGQRESGIHLALEEFSAADFQRLLGNEKELRALLDLIPKSEGDLRGNLVNAMIVRWLRLDRGAVVAWAPQALDFGNAAGRSAIWNTLPREIPEEMLALLPSRKDRIERLFYSG